MTQGDQPVDEAQLGRWGIHRIEIPLPFLEAGGPANAYAIEERDGGYCLFDTGLGTPEAWAAFQASARAAGVALERTRRIIVSHGHIDHYGNAQNLAELSGAHVHVHPLDALKLLGDGRWAAHLMAAMPYLGRLGTPRTIIDEMISRASARTETYARPVEPLRIHFLQDGQVFEFARFSARVVHLPGHTPGLVCLYSDNARLLFADDHILARISPNPLIDLSLGDGDTKFRALCAYLESVRKVMALPADIVLPGHGPAFTGHVALLANLLEFYKSRQERLLRRLGTSPASVYELLGTLFNKVDVGRMFLMLSETLANLEVLETQGRVQRLRVDGIDRWSPGPG